MCEVFTRRAAQRRTLRDAFEEANIDVRVKYTTEIYYRRDGTSRLSMKSISFSSRLSSSTRLSVARLTGSTFRQTSGYSGQECLGYSRGCINQIRFVSSNPPSANDNSREILTRFKFSENERGSSTLEIPFPSFLIIIASCAFWFFTREHSLMENEISYSNFLEQIMNKDLIDRSVCVLLCVCAYLSVCERFIRRSTVFMRK